LPLVSPRLPIQRISPVPVKAPLPQATMRWPESLSASAVEALRGCPYRFFSRVILGLGEADELDRMLAKRDYGNWLHAVLWRFHLGRVPTANLEADRERLHAAAREEQEASPHGEGELLPFLASFEALVEPYLRWLHEREAAGWQWAEGEVDRRITPAALGGVALRGRLDRVDRHAEGRVHVLDYKTGSVSTLKEHLADRSEDTQLAFYAALLSEEAPAASIAASYLAMDDRLSPLELTHAQVGESAVMLVQRLGEELQRLRAGEPLRALGQGALCDHCEARGLCRRDHWAAEEPAE
jgi:ATP-dependent helicase/nuclease subunit B